MLMLVCGDDVHRLGGIPASAASFRRALQKGSVGLIPGKFKAVYLGGWGVGTAGVCFAGIDKHLMRQGMQQLATCAVVWRSAILNMASTLEPWRKR
jgi:hypothetical protein